MSHRKMRAYRQAAGAVAFAAILCLCVCADSLVEAMMPSGEQVKEPTKSQPVESGVLTRGIAEGQENSTDMSAILMEDMLIEAALLEQGYYREDVPLDFVYQDILQTACGNNGVPYELALAVIEQESQFDPDAIGPDGHDVGLFQIRKSNHDWLMEATGADPTTPNGNILCGVWFLAYLYDYCGQSWNAALTCWRWGPGNGETSEYAEAVLSGMEKWR